MISTLFAELRGRGGGMLSTVLCGCTMRLTTPHPKLSHASPSSKQRTILATSPKFSHASPSLSHASTHLITAHPSPHPTESRLTPRLTSLNPLVAENFFLNFEAKVGALVALYVWTLGLKGFFDKMMFTTLRHHKTARRLRDSQPLPQIVS
jgi:hypothetical protein